MVIFQIDRLKISKLDGLKWTVIELAVIESKKAVKMLLAQISHKWSAFPMNMDGHLV